MSKHIAAIQYGTYTDEQLLELAVVEVNESEGFTLMGTPKPNGLYDQRMGPVERISICKTCELRERACPGHLGYIRLSYPAYNPCLISELLRLMRVVCMSCKKFIYSNDDIFYFSSMYKLAYAGAIEQAQAMSENPYILCDPINAESEEASLVPSLVSYTKDQKRSIEKRIDTILKGLSTQYGFASLEKYLEHRRTNPDALTRATILRITTRFIKTKKRKCTHCGLLPPLIKLYRSRTFYTTVEDELVTTEKEAAKEKKAAATKKKAAAKKEKKETKKSKKNTKKKAKNDNDDGDENDDAMDVQDDDDDDDNNDDNDDKQDKSRHKIVEHEVDEEILEKDPETKTQAATNATMESSILPTTMIDLVKHLFTNYATLMSYMYGKEASSKMFFMTLVPVVPNRLRPPMLRMGQYYENDMNSCYAQIIMVSKQISTLFSAPDFSYQSDKVKNLLASLQLAVNGLFDDKMAELSVRDKSKFPGIKNKIEKKYGYLRWNVMGKRVNFAARSVILPDPYVATNEVSVPRFFAMRLTYPEQVTSFNVDKLRALVIAGAKQYPGANMVDTGEGFQTDLNSLSAGRRLALAKSLQPTHRVLRHVQDGDPLLLNRQPTLHRPSVMAVKARVLNDQKVIRFHYANCKSFNADFDGDEMNLHLPQDALARSEAIHIMDAAKQYISPTSGEPLRGLIQDHIVSGVLLTQKDTFLTREEYQWLVFGCLYEFAGKQEKLETLQPCILKPVPLWSGKQVVSAILMHNNGKSAGINLDCKAKCKDALWGAHTEEGTVIIRDNQLLTGVMDKNQYGASAHGLVHACYECYGADNAQRLLTIFTRLTTIYLQYHGFTCGLDDCLLKASTDEQLLQQFTLANTKNQDATIKFAKEHANMGSNISETLAQALMNKNNYRKFDSAVKKELNEITSKVIKLSIPSGQYKAFPKNFLTLMTESGAKGSLVNASQISCCLGLQEFEGKRIRHSATGKTLPVFEEFDTSAMAGGYVSGRFLTGITPQEFFFHTMGGREGLIDTAVKTARSGYLQRSMVKMMEGLYTTYDYTVRDTDKSVVQFFYGEDGVDPSKASFMEQFKFLAMNSKALCQKYRIEDVADAFEVDGSAHKSVNKHMKRLLKRSRGKYNDLSNTIDPVMNRYDPMHHVGSISEKYAMQIADYCKRNPDHMLQNNDNDNDDDDNENNKLTQDLFKAIAHLKFMRSFAEPGDAVGVLAAQGVGEPSTQMTLNTFHFAGLDMAHVTVGIPRLVELLMSGGIKAPLMSIPASSKCTVAQGEKCAYQLSELRLKDILQQLSITEELLNSNHSYVSVFTVKMKFDSKSLSKVTKLYWERIIKSSLILPLLGLLHTQGKTSGTAYNFVQKSVQEEMLEQHRKEKNSNDNEEYADAVEYDDNDDNDDDDDDNNDDNDADKDKTKKPKKQLPSTEETASADEIASRMDKYARYLRSCRISESAVELQIEMDYAKNRVFLTQTIERLCEKGFVQKTPGLNKVTLVLDKGKPKDFQVDGLNRDKILHYDLLGTVFDLNKFTTNDVNFLVDTYGVEAGREMIVRELKSVFNSYGIPVDMRHLTLIGDFMTKDGTYQANNRRTATMRTGALSKMTFETASSMLVNSVCTSEYDIMNDPSSRIATGQVMPFGTGIFDLLMAE